MGGVIPKIKIKRFKQLITGSRIKGLKKDCSAVRVKALINI